MTDLHGLVDEQFGPRADAYVTSAVHARGEDLDALGAAAKAGGFARALDLGCGGGHVSFTLAPHVAAVTAYDLSPAMLEAVSAEAARRGLANVTTAEGVAERLPFPNGSFDLVATRFSAHHWRDVPAALAEARRVLAPGSTLMVMDTVAPETPLFDSFLQAIEMLRDPSHVRDYRLSEWTAMLKEAGFVPGAPVSRRLRLDFAAWVARMRTPELQVNAIRGLMARMPGEVRDHFELAPDGSHTIDTAGIAARCP